MSAPANGPKARPPRYARASDFPVQPPGVCRFCKGKVAPPRKSWCSQRCVTLYMAARSGEGMRKAVLERDLGVCYRCRLDCLSIETALRVLQARDKRLWRAFRERLGMNEPFRKTCWDADHIVAVADGGGSRGPENCRTLCMWCHRAVSLDQIDKRLGRPAPPRPSGAEFVGPIVTELRASIARPKGA